MNVHYRPQRITAAYLVMMQQAHYCAEATDAQLEKLSKSGLPNVQQMYAAATAYAKGFMREDETGSFFIGHSNFQTVLSFILAIEAARALADGDCNDHALKLLELAAKDLRRLKYKYEGPQVLMPSAPTSAASAPKAPVQAIETHYRGYRMRSRLEARWAVVFTALRLPWVYEPQGYKLASGARYLLDFRVKLARCTLWVEVKPEEEFSVKFEELSESFPDGDFGVLLHGIPDPEADCGGWCALFGMEADHIQAAFRAGRSARFEHGEQGGAS